ncbi:MAG: phosphoribosylglycinamide formyltransferase [Coriobacteriales bacterium]|jgi:phosphoribosylglycinamide formyltransferase-1|nr:phosphoribosylglycinamide formyltransferase [Coriobacteriales bacterium]
MIRLGVLISGSGTNLQAIIDATESGALDAEVVLVVSSKPNAYGLVRAHEAGIPTMALTRDAYVDPTTADVLIAQELKAAGAQYVVMAGYMRKVGHPLLEAFKDRVINIHPALLPSFAGAHGIGDAFDAGVKLTGVTVHFANEEYDTGPIIAQSAVEVAEDDDLQSLEARIHATEHVLLPQTLQLIAEGRVSIDASRKVCITYE